ncbi:MAG: hypothetical protein ABI624_07480 [Casimicrobiaceae bacterium]
MKLFFEEEGFDGQLQRTVGKSDAGMANVGECLYADAFRSALPNLPRRGRVVEGDTPGYLFAPPTAGPFPTILHIGGYDSTAEELYASVYPALDRGWACWPARDTAYNRPRSRSP